MMEPPLAGGGLGGHPEDGAAYATLLNTVESLQADLQQTITTCHGLREANAQLSREHEATKAELARQREKVSANRGELIRASKAKIEADRHTELLVSKWKVQEELEAPHQQKIADLEAQARSFQQMFFNVRRELERSKTEFEQFSGYEAAARRNDGERAAAEARSLRARIAELESGQGAGSLAEAEANGRRLEGKVVGLEVANRELRAECDELRKDGERAAADVADALAAKAKAGAAGVAALADDAAAAARAEEKRAKAHRSRVDELESRVLELTRDLDAARQGAAREESFRRRLEALESDASTAKRAAFEARVECDSTVAAARSECQALVASLEERVVVQDLDKTDRDKKRRAEDAARLDETRKLEAQLKVAAANAARLEADAERGLKPKLLQLADDKAKVEGERDGLQRKLDVLVGAQDAALKARDDADRAAGELAAAKKALADLERDAADLKADKERMREAHAMALGELKNQVANDKLNVAAAIRAETENIRRQAEEQLRRERKRAATYKEKCLAAHEREKRATATLKTVSPEPGRRPRRRHDDPRRARGELRARRQ
ncbi:hypothetical protein JL721_1634 [Aureococcus anophagefferens]|nr:hypothetical protein JL721_1634 [Aureococcus anophagefferens]